MGRFMGQRKPGCGGPDEVFIESCDCVRSPVIFP
jgi:hypothetical protein